MLNIVYAYKQFQNHMCGHPTKVMTGYLPLLSIFKKKFNKIISVRLQKIEMKLIIYDL